MHESVSFVSNRTNSRPKWTPGLWLSISGLSNSAGAMANFLVLSSSTEMFWNGDSTQPARIESAA
jgi:hypothetical protein